MTQERIDIVVSERGSKEASSRIKDIGSSAEKSQGSVQLLNRVLGTIGTVATLRALQQTVDSYTNLQNALKQVTDGSDQLKAVTKELYDISQRTRTSFEANGETYRRFALAGKDLGLSQRDVLQLTERVNKAVILSGAGAQEAAAGLLQFSQGLASGTLRGDELRSVMEQIPVVGDVIAQHLGVTRGELRKMGEQGKISSKIIIEAFQAAGVELDEKFAKSVPTIGQAFQVLRNSVVSFIGEADKALGLSTAVAGALIAISQNIGLVADALIIAAGAWAGYWIAVNLGAFVSVVGAIFGNIVAFIQLAGTVRNVTQAVALFNAAFLANPLTLFIALLGAAGAAAFVFRKELEASLIFAVTEIIVAVDTAILKLREFVDYATSGIAAASIGVRNLVGNISDDEATQALLELGNRSKPQRAFDPEILRQTANEMIEGLAKTSDDLSSTLERVIPGGRQGTVLDPEVQKQIEEAMKRQQKLLESLKGAQVNYNQTVGDLNALHAQGKLTSDELADALRNLNTEVLENDKTLNGGYQRGLLKLQDEFSNLSTLAENTVVNAFHGMEDALVDFVTTGKADFKGFVDSILADLARIAIRKAITAPLLKLFGFSDGGLVEGFATGGLYRGSGTGTSDSNLVRISDGEYIVNAQATKQFKPILDFYRQ